MTQAPSLHPVVTGVERVHAALDGIGDAQPLFLTPQAKKQALRAVVRAEARLAALKLAVLAVAGDVAEETAARDAGAWLARDQHLDPSAARVDQRLATALDARWTRTAAALADGAVHADQARVIVAVLDQIADQTDPELRDQAEERLLTEARHLNPAELRRLGRRLLALLDPEGAEEREAKQLEEEEQHASRKQRLSLKRLPDGTTRLSALLPHAVAHRLSTYLDAFAQPRKQATEADGRLLPRSKLLAIAFGDLLNTIDPERLPQHGGDATTVVVTLDYASLTKAVGLAGLGWDADGDDLHLSAAAARRLACQAGILPMVLGSQSEILDVGRKQRLHPPAMRRAIRLRDKTCRAEGCDVPANWCEVHHLIPWSEGGKTSVKDGALLCSHHHHVVHDPSYRHERLPDGTIRYHRRR